MFCPDKKGFFPLLYTKLRESIDREELAAFEKLASIEERIQFASALPRLTGEDDLFKIVKPIHGEKVRKEKDRLDRAALFYACT